MELFRLFDAHIHSIQSKARGWTSGAKVSMQLQLATGDWTGAQCQCRSKVSLFLRLGGEPVQSSKRVSFLTIRGNLGLSTAELIR